MIDPGNPAKDLLHFAFDQRPIHMDRLAFSRMFLPESLITAASARREHQEAFQPMPSYHTRRVEG